MKRSKTIDTPLTLLLSDPAGLALSAVILGPYDRVLQSFLDKTYPDIYSAFPFLFLFLLLLYYAVCCDAGDLVRPVIELSSAVITYVE